MQTSSSTSDSERRFLIVALQSFALVLGVLTGAHELLVRTSETRHGMRPTNFGPPRLRKIEALVSDLAAGEHYDIYAIGTSRTEEGIRTDVVARSLGPTFNLGMGGSSLLAGFEALEQLDEHPRLILAGVTPMDFTKTAMKQGSAAVRLAQDSIALIHRSTEIERGPAVVARTMMYELLHGAAPERKRNLGQWFDLYEKRGDLLAFLNNGDALEKRDVIWIHGFLGVAEVATPARFRELRPVSTPGEYLEEHAPLYARLQNAVERQRARGTEVVFVRMPLAPIPRKIEDDVGFDDDIRAAAARCSVRFIDGSVLMGDAFIHDPRNFVDGGHLNIKGASVFSRKLAETLSGSH